jgi:hypothetical protein
VGTLAGLAGFTLGLSVLAHPTTLIFIPVFLLYSCFVVMRQRKLAFVTMIASLGVVLLFVGLINHARFGSFAEFGYGYFSTLAANNGWSGLVGLLASPGAGLIFFFPLAVLIPLGAKYMYKENRALFFLCLYIIISTWIYTGTLSFGSEPNSWSGGIAWGPRYLVPVLPFMIIILAYLFPHIKNRYFIKSIIIGLCLAGFYVNLSGILIWFQYGLLYAWTMEGLAIYPNYMDIITWSTPYSPIVLHTKALISDYVTAISPQQYLDTSWSWAAYGNAPCRYDLYIYCNFGIVPFVVGIAGLVITAFIIISRVRICQFLRLDRFAQFFKNNYAIRSQPYLRLNTESKKGKRLSY